MLKDLESRNTYARGTMTADRGRYPDGFKTQRLQKCNAIFLRDRKQATIHQKNKKLDVCVMLTIHGNGMEAIGKSNEQHLKKNH